jgi:nucleoside-diphosphate-sugar epimerase
MKVLITGGGGFIGSHLVDSQLTQGHQVRTVDLHLGGLVHAINHPNLEAIIGDITDVDFMRQLVAGIDVVYHLASAHLDVNLSADHYRQVNVEATMNLLVAAQAAGVQRMVHCSSNGVMGEIKKPPANEATPCQPTNIYEQTKWIGEQAVLQFAQETGFPVVVVRPAWVYGPRCPRTRKLFRTIGKGHFVMFGSGRTLRHPIYVSDAVCGLELCAETDNITGQVYLLAGERPVTIATLVQMIAEVQGVRPPSIHFPVTLGKVAGIAFQTVFKPLGRQPPFSRRSLDFFIKDNAYDISKAKRDLGFQPQVDLPAGLIETWHWLNGCKNNQTQLSPSLSYHSERSRELNDG